jgi:hypothetical protein
VVFADVFINYIRNLRALKKYMDEVFTIIRSWISPPAKCTFIIYYNSRIGAVPCGKPGTGSQ